MSIIQLCQCKRAFSYERLMVVCVCHDVLGLEILGALLDGGVGDERGVEQDQHLATSMGSRSGQNGQVTNRPGLSDY